MNLKSTIVGIACLWASCDSSVPTKRLDLQPGDYTGTFFRVSPVALYPVANVNLFLMEGEFRGDTDTNRYPAICPGTYAVSGTTVEFTNDCVWTADFDWSLILSGTFEFTATSDSLHLVKHNGDVTDIYRLKRNAPTIRPD